MSDPLIQHPTGEISSVILLGGLLQSFFLGLVLAQGARYWADYRDDSRLKRLFVATVILLGILQTALEDYQIWSITVFGQKWSKNPLQWTELFLNGLICSLCEAFYIRRCWKMTQKSPWALYPLSFLSATVFVANIILAVSIQLGTHMVEDTNNALKATRYFLPSLVSFSYWIFGSLALKATVTSIFTLWRSKTGLVETDRTVRHVISLTWESAILPCISMFIAAMLYLTTPHTDTHLVVFFVVMTAKLDTLGLLRTLNSRASLRTRMQSHDLGRTSLSGWQWDQAPTNSSALPDDAHSRTSISGSNTRWRLSSDFSAMTAIAPDEDIPTAKVRDAEQGTQVKKVADDSAVTFQDKEM